MAKSALRGVVAPSILASDFGSLTDECRQVLKNGARAIHVDTMDGHFVPNMVMGAPVVKSLRAALGPDVDLDCHLMVSNPEQWLGDYVKAGATGFTFHLEALDNDADAVVALAAKVKAAGLRCGVAVKPKTPLTGLHQVLAHPDCQSGGLVDLLLVMTVEPGFGGQSFMMDQMPRVRELREKYGDTVQIQVDGGVGPTTIEAAVEAGANNIVAGSSVYGSANYHDAIATLQTALDTRFQ